MKSILNLLKLNYKVIDSIVSAAAILHVILGVAARIYGYILNRSLWLDEAFLASSIVRRDFLDLLDPLDFNQGAPIGFLWLTKILVYIFGSSEFVLRLLPLLAGLSSIYLFYILMYRLNSYSKPWVGTAFFAAVPFLVYYSFEFKPYMVDAFITLSSLILITKIYTRNLKPQYLFIYSAAIVWISFPAIFLLTAFYLLWFVDAALKKDTEFLKLALIGGTITMVSFLFYYFTLYGNLAGNQSLAYWDLIRFPLIPKDKYDLELIKEISKHYLETYGSYSYSLAAFSIASIFILLFGKFRPLVLLILSTILLVLAASWLGKYGMLNRILLFVYPLNVLVIVLALYQLANYSKHLYYVGSLWLLILCVPILQNFKDDKIYRHNRELKPLINKIKDSDLYPLYAFRSTVPQLQYYTNYINDMKSIPKEPTYLNGILYGSKYYNHLFKKPYSWESEIDSLKLRKEANTIADFDSIYLLFGNGPNNHFDALLAELEKNGKIHLIDNYYGCSLNLFIKDIKNR
jgi:4-amino-4-deoxy-L-arabinose transferase-like glycosyltransferase